MMDSNENSPNDPSFINEPIQQEVSRYHDTDQNFQSRHTRKRPSSPFAIGLTLIIGGSLYIVINLISFAGMIIQIFEVFKEVEAFGGNTGAISLPIGIITQPALLIILSVTALIVGIGLIRYRNWARKLAIVWAVAALVYIIGNLGFQFIYGEAGVFIRERMEETYALIMAVLIVIVTNLVNSVVPVLTLIFMRRRPVIESCS